MYVTFKCFSFSFSLELKVHQRFYVVIEDVKTSEQIKHIPQYTLNGALALATELTRFYANTDMKSYNWIVYDGEIPVRTGAYEPQQSLEIVAVPFINR